MSDKHYVGLDLTGFEDNGKTRPISRVTLSVDENNVITAGDDTGMELTADCPHATQAMADAILARIKGYRYQMFTADAANIDPAAELGDGVTAGGVYGVLSRLNDDGGGFPNIEAPGEAELEDEYPTGGGPMTKVFNRKLAYTRSLIEKSAEEIRLAIEATDGRISELKVTLDGVTIRDESGQTRIKGSSIETGSVTADKLNVKGSITFEDLDSNAQNTIYNQHTSLPSYIKNTYIDRAEIRSPTIKANVFEVHPSDESDPDGSFDLYGNWAGKEYHMLSISYSASGDTPELYISSPAEADIHIGNQIGDYTTVYPTGNWDFSEANVTGLHMTFTA